MVPDNSHTGASADWSLPTVAGVKKAIKRLAANKATDLQSVHAELLHALVDENCSSEPLRYFHGLLVDIWEDRLPSEAIDR